MATIGFREWKRIRRADESLIGRFKGIPVPNIDDNMGRLYAVSSDIRPLNRVPLLGQAFTVKAPQGDNMMFHRALDLARPGDIIVVDGRGGMDRALCGEIMIQYAMRRGIGGFLIDGCVRDALAIESLDFPVYARGLSPNGPYKNGPGEINVPVCIGGVAVMPGDIVVGDADGVVIVPLDDAAEAAEKAIAHNRMEEKMFEQIAAGTFDHSWVEKAVAAGRIDSFDESYGGQE